MAYRIVLDAMGGDYAPHEILKGMTQAVKEDNELEMILVGDQDAIEKELKHLHCKKTFQIVHTDQWISMDDSPKKALAQKPNASIVVSTQLLQQGKGDVLVSAGNTGATVLAAAQNLRLIEGIERAGLAAIYPTPKFYASKHGFALMLDVGATLHCTPKQLVHFAIMGSYYAGYTLGIENPRVGLLNIGEEETKGGEVLVQTHAFLKELPGINFIGNIEGKDIPKGIADVVVTEGFVGNVVLKLMEGASEVLKDTGKYAFKKKFHWKLGLALLYSGVKKLKHKTDYAEYGGAPILGFEQVVIKAHGRSNARAIKNAIKVAKRSVTQDVNGHISQSVKEFNQQHKLDFLEI